MKFLSDKRNDRWMYEKPKHIDSFNIKRIVKRWIRYLDFIHRNWLTELIMYAYQWVCFWDFLLKFSGDMYEIGAESGRHYSVNVPLKEGIDDQSKYVYMYIRG